MEHSTYEECWTCRRRRVQCDQSRIPCMKCEKAGLECFIKRPLRWIKGVAIRGNMQGRSFGCISESSSALKPIQKSISKRGFKFVCTKSATIRSLQVMWKANSTFTCKDIPPGLPTALKDPLTSSLDPVTRYYMEYCKYSVWLKERNFVSWYRI